jgi:flagellar protein FliS
MAYDGIIENMNEAVNALQSTPQSYEVFNEKLSQAQQIVLALEDGLDEGEGELPAVLASFYDFIRKKLIESNMEKSSDGLQEVIAIVEQVRTYWEDGSTQELNQISTQTTEDKKGFNVTG